MGNALCIRRKSTSCFRRSSICFPECGTPRPYVISERCSTQKWHKWLRYSHLGQKGTVAVVISEYGRVLINMIAVLGYA